VFEDTYEEPQYTELPNEYIKGFLDDLNMKEYDTTYGISYNPETKGWMLGNKSIEFHKDDDDFTIDTKTFKGTRGLYELLFKKDPVHYTKNDEKKYYEILNITNVHKRHFDPTGYLKGTNLSKYRNIIRPLVTKSNKRRSKSFDGTGINDQMLEYNSNNIDYVYWDDPNELVDRLRLLMASTEAGNTSLNNEQLSIIKELIETGVIKEADCNNIF
jgi:hypothetical protein